MAHALPVSKLAGLLVRTLSKPLAKRVKHEFSRFPITQRFLIRIGQTSHAITSRMTIWSAGFKVRSITPLEPDKALSLGADLIGESVVLLVSGGVVVVEYNRSKDKEKEKEAEKHREAHEARMELQAKLNALDARLKALETVVKAQSHSILNFGVKYVEQDTVPIDVPVSDSGDGVKRPGSKSEIEATAKEDFIENGLGGAVHVNSSGSSFQRSVPSGDGSTNLSDRQRNERDSVPGRPSPTVGEQGAQARRWGWWGWWPF